MLRLHTFGGHSITANDAPLSGAVARRRSLALLALAAAASDAGVNDEHALALLWPDFDLPRARNNLKQVVFTLRHALGREVFSHSSTALRLDPSLISVDRWDFERAIADGDAERAIAIYRGPFLDGFHIAGLAEFERWVEAERERLAHAFTDALTSVALAADAAGDHLCAIAWWRRLVTEDPLNDLSAQKLVRALAASGDAAGALQHARVHESLVAQELDLKPSAGFLRLVQDIRAGRPLAGDASSTIRVPTPPLAVQAIAMGSVRSEERLPHRGLQNGSAPPDVRSQGRANGQVTPPTGATRYPRRRQIWTTGERRVAGFTTRFTTAALALVVVGAMAAFTVVRFGPSQPSEPEGGASATVVLPFTVNAGNDTGNLGAVVSELLAASLDGSLGLRALAVGGVDRRDAGVQDGSVVTRRADARWRATRLGAGFYVTGEVFESGDRLRITAEFRSRHDESMNDRAVVEGMRGDLFDLVDRVASRLLAGRIAGGRRDVVRVASVTTSSLRAAKAYFQAESALAEGRFRAAIDAYEEAVRLDSMFALAHYGLASAADMLGGNDLVQSATNQARRFASRLPGRQRRLLAAFVARQQGHVADARRLYAQLTTDYPADVEAWMGLGETLFHLNPLQGEPSAAAGVAFLRAATLDSLNTSAWVHLARIAALEGDEHRSQRMVARARRVAPEPAVAQFAVHVMSLGLPGLDDSGVDPGTGRSAAMALTAADAVALLTSDGSDELRRFARRLATGSTRGYGLRLLSLVEAGNGKIHDAFALLDTCQAASHSLAVEARSSLAALSFIPLDSVDIERVRKEVLAWAEESHTLEDAVDSVERAATHPYVRLHRLGLLALRLQDTAAVESLVYQLRELTRTSDRVAGGRELTTSLRAHIAAARGRSREALNLLADITGRAASSTPLEAYDRLLYARLLEERQRYDEALRYYAQLGTRSPFELALLWQAELGMARIHEKRGERALAADYYRRAATRLENADSSLADEREAAARSADALLPLNGSGRLR